ncbi:Ankyrin repeat-containing protein [Dysgonomonas macrotermitis]|uniref:Ankyrin repeat-containing protein n=2 Tax=Dysgonomonas macrotermitis TaxID=1346286 RepID=A0A1M5FMD0_9BACT|nr:Ankyrin repeat-containing protein [Dysgonomonas macrotermitis]
MEQGLLSAVRQNNYTQVTNYLLQRVSPDITDYYGQSLLMLAIRDKSKRVAQLLASKGANVNYRIKQEGKYGDTEANEIMAGLQGRTVLDIAIESGDTTLVDILVRKGVSLNPENEAESPLYVASQNLDPVMLHYLSRHGAKATSRTARSILATVAQATYTEGMYREVLFRVVDFWVDQGVEISVSNLSVASPFRARIIDGQNSIDWDIDEMVDFVESYRKREIRKFKEEDNEIRKGERDQIADAERSVRILLNANQVKLQKRKELDVEKRNEEREQTAAKSKRYNDILTIAVVVIVLMFGVVIIIYLKYGSLGLRVWISVFRRLFGKQAKPIATTSVSTTIQSENKLAEKHTRHNTALSAAEIRGWKKDNTVNITLEYLTIEDMINPIRLCNEHEKAVRKMMWYIRRLEQYPDESVAQTLGSKGLLPHLKLLWKKTDQSMVRNVYKRSLYLMVENYGARDKRVLSFLKIIRKDY